MDSFLISYDLIQPHRNYKAIIEKIKDFNGWCHCLESIWIVKSNLSAEQIRDIFLDYIDYDDKLFVVKLIRDSGWYIADTEVTDWLQKNL